MIDRGPGIPETVAAQLFRPFFTTSGHGTGLGLYIARELCRANQATLEYVTSDDYVASYARNEGGMIQPGERRIVPLLQEATPGPTPAPPPTPDPALQAKPWQAWWRLLTDIPQPVR